MKAHFYLAWRPISTTLAICFCEVALAGATTNPAAGGSTNTAEPQIPQSVFVIPSEQKQGKDPFYPSSVRPYVNAAGKKPTIGQPPPVNLVLKGISGTGPHRLCIINNQTFEAGEDGEVSIAAGRIKVRCVEIKADSVIIEINGERQELRLRRGV